VPKPLIRKQKRLNALPGGKGRLNDVRLVVVGGDELMPDRHAVIEARKRGELLNRFSRYQLRGQWISDDRFQGLRQCAYFARMARKSGGLQNPAALAYMVYEAEVMLSGGVALPDMIEALCELLYHEA
jgi:hypothetical protein